MRSTTAKQNYPGLVAFYNTWTGNEVGLFYNAHKTTRLPLHSAYKFSCLQ